MSHQDIETLRAVYERWGHGDFWTPDVFEADVEIVWADDIPDVGVGRGLAGVERTIRAWLSAWEDMRMEAEEFIESEDGRVLVLVAAHGRGKGSGVELHNREYAHLWTMRNGKAAKLVGYTDRPSALHDAGLAI